MKKRTRVETADLFAWMKKGKLPAWAIKEQPTLHFCYDWDGLPVYEHMPEYEACTCIILNSTGLTIGLTQKTHDSDIPWLRPLKEMPWSKK